MCWALLLQWQSHFAPQNKEDFMLDKMIGFIGAGNMGSAMIDGILDASLVTTSQIIASAHSPETLDKIRTKFSIETTQSNEVVAERSDILFLAVKPNKFSEVLPQIKGHLKPDCIVVSIAAGQPIANIEALLGEVRLIRAMPNTPALVGAAMSALCPNDKVTPEEVKLVESLFNSFGRAEEKFFDNDVLEFMIMKSGGILRDLFAILVDASITAMLDHPDNKKILMEDAKEACTKLRNEYVKSIESKEQYNILLKIYEDPKNIFEDATLLQSLQANLVIEYGEYKEYQVHPLIIDYMRYRGDIS